MKIGKLENSLLEQIVFKNIKFKRPEVLVRSGVGEDCAVVDFGEYDCILSTDPITAAVSEIGRLAIDISCNDIASNGVEPLGIMLCVMLPTQTTIEDIECIMMQAGEEAERLGVEIIGGHTEITDAVTKPVIVSTAIAKAVKGKSLKPGGISVGDFIIVTKSLGLEGIGILATDYEDILKKILNDDEIKHAKGFLNNLSVKVEGTIACEIGVSGMHDITEGGLFGGVWEMCESSKLGAEIWGNDIPIHKITQKVCDHYNVDCLKLISSGCMLITVSNENLNKLTNLLTKVGVDYTCVGRITQKDKIFIGNDGVRCEIMPPSSDELYSLLKFMEEEREWVQTKGMD